MRWPLPVLATVLVACSSSPNTALDGGSKDGPGEASADGGPPDGPADVAPVFAGRRSFFVTSTITLTTPDAQAPGVPTAHTFTLVLDGDARRAWLGSKDGENVATFTATGGALHIDEAVSFSFSCGNDITYDDLTFTLDASGGVSGQARGKVDSIVTDLGGTLDAKMTLTGVTDTVAPTFTPSATSPIDPFTAVDFVASEPLPTTTSAAMVAGDGERVPLAPRAVDRRNAADVVSILGTPKVILQFGQTYDVQTTGLADFAGNQSVGNLQLTTVAAPPLLAEDGFESATGTMYGGGLLLGNGNAAVIAGAQSLYVPADNAPVGGPGSRAAAPGLTLRLALAPGDTVLRFSYRAVGEGIWPPFLIGSVGAAPTLVMLTRAAAATTLVALPLDTTSAVGPVQQAEIPLPASAHGEIFVERYVSATVGCGGGLPFPGYAGIIIDDVRAE
jgi:hypothetical protein